MKDEKIDFPEQDLDRLLGGQVRAPSEGFEKRLSQLIGGFGEEKRRVVGFPSWASWFAAGASVAALLVLGLFISGVFEQKAQMARREAPSYEELFVLEDDVGGGLPLTDPLILDAILNMPLEAES
jgi:hypothetical protein